MWSGPLADGDRHTRGFRELAPVIADLFGPMPYVAMQSLIDPLYPRGLHNYFRAAFLPTLDGASVDSILESYHTAPNPLSELHIHRLGGAVSRVPGDATAFATRDADFILNVVARAPDTDGFGRSSTGRAPQPMGLAPRVSRTSTSQVRQARTVCVHPTRGRPTTGWSRSRTATTRPTCSG
jgi:hypothetical protein